LLQHEAGVTGFDPPVQAVEIVGDELFDHVLKRLPGFDVIARGAPQQQSGGVDVRGVLCRLQELSALRPDDLAQGVEVDAQRATAVDGHGGLCAPLRSFLVRIPLSPHTSKSRPSARRVRRRRQHSAARGKSTVVSDSRS